MAGIVGKMRISQETFDEVVAENVEEFEMTLEDAVKDAVEQFTKQGADMSLVITTVRGKKIVDRVKTYAVDLTSFAEAKDIEADSTAALASFQQLTKLCAEEEEAKLVAIREGLVGASAFIVKLYVDDIAQKSAETKESDSPDVPDANEAIELGPLETDELVIQALDLLTVLFTGNNETREALPRAGVDAINSCIKIRLGHPKVVYSSLKVIQSLFSKNEAQKSIFHKADFSPLLKKILVTYGDNKDVFLQACRVLRRYILDDDRRPGVQPNTFVRARELGEDPKDSIITPLLRVLESFDSDPSFVGDICFTLKHAAVNDKVCKVVSSHGGLKVALEVFSRHVTEPKVALHASGLIKAVSRTDSIKESIGSGPGLGMLIIALENHRENSQVVEQVLGALSVLSLRMPENCSRIGDNGIVPLVVSAMSQFPDKVGVQRHAIMTLRNLVSSAKNKDLQQTILDEGAEDLINVAQDKHEMCKDVAFAALRDLGCRYEASYVPLS